MASDDPLTELLRIADASADVPLLPADLLDRVRCRREVQNVRRKRVRIGIVLGIMLLLAAVSVQFIALRELRRDAAPILARDTTLDPAEIDHLKAQASQSTLEADALERLMASRLRKVRLQELLTEYDRLLIATSQADSTAAALDRAAGNAECQADFLLETLGDRHAAEAAYRRVVAQFPDTHWAVVAQNNLTRLNMD